MEASQVDDEAAENAVVAAAPDADDNTDLAKSCQPQNRLTEEEAGPSSSSSNPEEGDHQDRKGKNEEPAAGSSSEAEAAAASGVFLDHNLWCNLPDHLFDIVLAWLPPASLFRLRTVCKRWSAITSTKTFLQACSTIRHRPPFFLMFADHFHRRVAAIYDTHLQSWYHFPFSSFMHCRFPESFLVLAAAGGLLCLEGTGSQSGRMFVSNPISRTWRKLPSMIPMKSPYVVGMLASDLPEHHHQQQQLKNSSSSYNILVAQDGDTFSSQIYDSSSDSWKMLEPYHKRTAILAGATFYRGLLYCLRFSPDGLLAFDPIKEQWQEVQPRLPASLSCPNLMTHRDRLILIGGVEEHGCMKSVHVWQLLHSSSTPEWIQLATVPDEHFKRLFTPSSGHFICVGLGDFVCLHEYYSPDILMFDLANQSWHWLPSCSLNENLEARSVLGFAFEPRIEAVP